MLNQPRFSSDLYQRFASRYSVWYRWMWNSVLQFKDNYCGYWSVFAIAFLFSLLDISKDVAKKCWIQEKVEQKKINGHHLVWTGNYWKTGFLIPIQTLFVLFLCLLKVDIQAKYSSQKNNFCDRCHTIIKFPHVSIFKSDSFSHFSHSIVAIFVLMHKRTLDMRE